MHKVPRPYADPGPLFRHGGAPDGLSPVLDFSASLNPLGPPASVRQVLDNAWPLVARYPDPACRLLTEQLAASHGVAPAQIIPGNGATELIDLIARAVRPRRVAIAEPTFTEYLRASLRVGAAVDHWLASDRTFQPEPFDPEGADLVWLCNPNNPTGQLWPSASLRSWIAAHPRSLFVVDEAFLPFRADENEHSLIPALARLPNLVVLRSLTKVFALPGLRLGYAVSSPELAGRLRAHLVPWSVNALAQAAGLAVLEDRLFLQQSRAWLQKELPVMMNRLQGLTANLEVVPSWCNFLLLRIRGVPSCWLTRQLRERGIWVRDASNFVGLDHRFLRVAVRTQGDNRLLFHHLWTCLASGDEDEGDEADPEEEECPSWPDH